MEKPTSYIASQSLAEDELIFSMSNEIERIKNVLKKDYGPFEALDNLALERARFSVSCDPRVHTVLSLRAQLAAMNTTIMRVKSIKSRRQYIQTESEVSTSVQKEGAVTTAVVEENLEDVAGSDLFLSTAGRSFNAPQGQRNVLDMGDFLSRPIKIYSATFAVATNYDIIINPWNLFFAEPSVRAKIKNYAFFRGNLHLRLAIAGNPFMYGRKLVSYQPLHNSNQTLIAYAAALAIDSNLRSNFLTYLSQADGSALMDVSKNEPLEIVCPFISTKPMHRLFNNSAPALGAATAFDDMNTAGALYISTLNQVQTVNAASSAVYLQIYAWVDDAELGTNTATQIVINTESKVDERVVGPVEIVASRLYQVSSALVAVPYLEPFAIASSMAFKAIGGIAAIFGWSKPSVIAKPVIVRPEPFQNGAMTIGFDTTKRVVLDPKQELSVDSNVVGVAEDCMAIQHIAKRKSYYTTFAWANADVPLSVPIFKTGVTPSLTNFYDSGVLDVWSQPTALAFATTPFFLLARRHYIYV